VQVKAGVAITEFEVTEIIETFRAKMADHVGPSFGTIAGYGPNGAMMHYSPSKEVSATLGTDNMFLCDSGAQYLDGTTDVTR
jgi:Xaa-Pro aminopeptidase